MLTTEEETIFLNHENFNFIKNVWMVSLCTQTWVNETIKEFCENRNLRHNLELVVPVSDSRVNYRNKFCAYCNGVTASHIFNWEVEFYCHIDLSYRRKNFISAVKKHKCNLFFMPKGNMVIESCRKRTIIQKSTGCIKTVRGPIRQSCGVFKAPFMLTSVCHYCNTTDHLKKVDEICYLDSYFFGREDRFAVTPPFLGILDLSALETRTQTQQSCDPLTEFDDKIAVSIYLENIIINKLQENIDASNNAPGN